MEWIPKTKLGKMVKNGEITDFEQIYQRNLPILEPEIIDALVPNLREEVLNVQMVQRTTDSGRKGSFLVTAAIGNEDGFIGMGTGKGKEVRPTIETAVREAKRNIIKIRRGCGSWECGCGTEHSLPFRVTGRRSSVRVDFLPAPKGTGIVAGETARKILTLAGIKDVWSKTSGHTPTTFNFAGATVAALRKTRKMRLAE